MREHANQVLDQLDTSQLAAVSHLLAVVTDPLSRSVASAPVDEEPISAAEAAALDEAHAAMQRGEGISHEELLREFGISR
jgi:hypothetical protein